jgi:NADH-quinone oxidoreductase subunit N
MLDLAVTWKDAIDMSLAGTKLLAPECILIATACLALLLDLVIPRERSGYLLAWVAIAGTVAASVGVWHGYSAMVQHPELFPPTSVFWGAVAVDPFAAFFKLVILLGTLFSIVLIHESQELRGRSMGEFYGLLFSAVAGMFLMVGATDMVVAFLAIELVSIPSFALVAYLRQDRHCTEASLKYVLYGAFSSGLMLFGLSILFGFTGSTSFNRVGQFLAGTGPVGTVTVAVASLLAFAGFAYKMAAAPFHFWAPDVYQGAPTPVTAWLSVTSKAAGIGLFMRFVLSFMTFTLPSGSTKLESHLVLQGFDWVSAIMVISAITMTIGNFGALFQTSMKRLLAYSSVAHVGYILMGLAAVQATPTGPANSPTTLQLFTVSSYGYEISGGAAIAFYIAVYALMNLGAFGCVIAVQNVTGSDDLSSFRALGRRSPILALALAIFIFSLIGLPPTAGFTGKLQLFMAAVAQASHRSSFWVLVGIAGVNTAVSVYYYLRVAKVMYLDGLMEPDAREPLAGSYALTFVCMFLVLPVIGFGLFFNRIVELAMNLELLRS